MLQEFNGSNEIFTMTSVLWFFHVAKMIHSLVTCKKKRKDYARSPTSCCLPSNGWIKIKHRKSSRTKTSTSSTSLREFGVLHIEWLIIYYTTSIVKKLPKKYYWENYEILRQHEVLLMTAINQSQLTNPKDRSSVTLGNYQVSISSGTVSDEL